MATLRDGATAFAAFQRALPVAILRGLRNGLRRAERASKTQFMQRKDNRHPKVWDPPNPPPGPLAIRSGKLARTVKVAPMRWDGRRVMGALQAGGQGVDYAGIHEFGGRAGRGHRSIIRPRPYLGPAIESVRSQIEQDVVREMRAAARATLRQIARGV